MPSAFIRKGGAGWGALNRLGGWRPDAPTPLLDWAAAGLGFLGAQRMRIRAISSSQPAIRVQRRGTQSGAGIFMVKTRG